MSVNSESQFKIPSARIQTSQAGNSSTKGDSSILPEHHPTSSLSTKEQKTPIDENQDSTSCLTSQSTVSTSKKDTRPASQIVTTCTVSDKHQIYKEPPWSTPPPEGFFFEIIKQGVVLAKHCINKPYLLIGRLPECDIRLEHPSVSRYHAVLQYCKGEDNLTAGFYIFDLGSTHETFVNKSPVKAMVYLKIEVGYVLKFGLSTRIFVFQGPEMDEMEKENESPVIEEIPIPSEPACNWGLGEDAIEDNSTENPFALPHANEDLYLSDPKKTLRGWYEREGYDLEYKVEERGKKFVCSLHLPVDSPSGEGVIVEGAPTGKKKEAVVDCALEACRVLDRLSLLRQSQHESRQPKRKNWEEDDYYDSDEDPFLDRTGALEKKREWRKKMTKKPHAETHETIEKKLKIIDDEIVEIKTRLENSRKGVLTGEIAEEIDPLDSYMTQLQEMQKVSLHPVTVSKMRNDLAELEKQKKILEQLRVATASSYLQQSDLSQNIELPPRNSEFGNGVSSTEIETKMNSTDINMNNNSPDPSITPENVPACSSKQYNQRSTQESVSVVETIDLALAKTKVTVLPDDSKETTKCYKRPSSTLPLKSIKKKTKAKPVYDSESQGSTDYSMWLPPMNQSGDGNTHLNNKYDY